MGDLVPSNETSMGEYSRGCPISSWQGLANIYLSKDSGRTEQLNTANAIIATGLSMLAIPKPSLGSYEECEQAVRRYFQECAERNVRPSISGLGIAFGITRKQFLEGCETGQVTMIGTKATVILPQDVWNLFINLRDNYTAMLEGFLETNLIHPSAATFLLKNNCGYKEEVTHNYNVTRNNVDVSAFAEKYKDELDNLT